MKILSKIKFLAFIALIVVFSANIASAQLPLEKIEKKPLGKVDWNDLGWKVGDALPKQNKLPPIPLDPKKNNSDGTPKADAAGAGAGTGTATASGGDVFDVVTIKAITTLKDLRHIVYVIAGLGLVVVAWGAIFGKLSFKHLANLGMGLFLIATMAPFIEYFTGEKPGVSLGYGNYLDSNYTKLMGSDSIEDKECIKGSDGECAQPDASKGSTDASKSSSNTALSKLLGGDITKLAGELPGVSSSPFGDKKMQELSNSLKDLAAAGSGLTGTGADGESGDGATAKKGYSWGDLWGSVQKVGDVVTTAATIYGGAKNTIEAFNGYTDTLQGGVKGLGSSNPFDAIQSGVNAMGALDGLSSLGRDKYYGFGSDVARLGNNTQDVFSTNEERRDNAAARDRGESTNSVDKSVKDSRTANAPTVEGARDRGRDIGKKAGEISNVSGAVNNAIRVFKK